MDRSPAHDAARHILTIIPLVMRTVAAELRAGGDMPAPAHIALLAALGHQPRTLTELAQMQGVSLPTMSNSISTLVERGWVTRSSPAGDRRVTLVDVTPLGRTTLDRVTRAAEAHLAERLAGLDAASKRRLHAGLNVLERVFGKPPAAGAVRASRPPRTRRANPAARRSV